MSHVILTYRWLVKEIAKSFKGFRGLHKKKEKSESEFRGVLGSRDGEVNAIIKFIGNDDSVSTGDLKALENSKMKQELDGMSVFTPEVHWWGLRMISFTKDSSQAPKPKAVESNSSTLLSAEPIEQLEGILSVMGSEGAYRREEKHLQINSAKSH